MEVMIITKDMVKVNLVSINETSSDTVYLTVSKENTSNIFQSEGEFPRNNEGDEDWTFIAGDLQVMFTRGTDNLEEALLFPVYEDGEALENGDFTDVTENVTQEVIDYCKELLHEKSGGNR